MKWMVRSVSFVLGLATVAVPLVVFVETLKFKSLNDWTAGLRVDPIYLAVVWCMSGALMVFGLVALIKSVTARGPESMLLLVLGSGTIAISEKAIRAHILRTVLQTEGIRAPIVHTRINNRHAYIEADIAFSVFNDPEDLPALCRRMQSEITATVERFTSTPLKSILITVQDLRTRDKLKVV